MAATTSPSNRRRPETVLHREWCQRCGEELDPTKAVWLQLDRNTDIFYSEGKAPETASDEEWHAFGSTCAKKVANKIDAWADGYEWAF